MHESSLPVQSILEPLHETLESAPVILQAPPGAGKSTLLPLSLLRHNEQRRWILVQPRRLAALSIATYLAAQLQEPVGQQVGYQIRQQAKRSSKTRLLVVTEGILTRMLQTDPMLTAFDGVIFDEFHERNLHSDLGLALVLESLQLREDLKLLIMSATLPADALANWLREYGVEAQVLRSEGRQYPIQIDYAAALTSQRSIPAGATHAQYLDKTVQVVSDIVRHHPSYRGVLVFLPGQREINQVMQGVAEHIGTRQDVELLALHGALSLNEQQRVTAPIDSKRLRRVIFTTNIAETSLTIDGIDWVVDTGRERQAIYRPAYQISELVTRRIAKAAAEQRAGRAGRTGPGRCTRVYSESDWQGMAEYRPADIEQQDLTSLVLQVACWGSSVEQLAWFSAPNQGHLESAKRRLQQIGALNASGQVTAYGHQLGASASEVRYAHALAQARQSRHVAQAVCVLIALDETREQRRFDLIHAAEEILANVPGWSRSRQRIQYWLAQQELPTPTNLAVDTLLRAAVLVWPFGLARKRSSGDGYQLASGVGVQWAGQYQGAQSNRTLQSAAWLVVSAVSLHESQRNGRIQQAAALDSELVESLLSNELHSQVRYFDELRWGANQGSLRKYQMSAYHQLILTERASSSPITAEQRLSALCAYVREQGLVCLDWDVSSIQLVRRVNAWDSYHQRQPRFADTQLLASLEGWAAPFWSALFTLRELAAWQPYRALLSQLDYAEQQQLAQHLPSTWTAPSGRSHSIQYQRDGSALVSLKLQEVFGAAQSPRLLYGTLPLTLELLSPAGRPLQRTSDLAGFWQGAYASVKKEMRGRYPKHPWPDEPISAIATHLTKRAFNG